MRRLKSVMICASMILAAFVTFIPGTLASDEDRANTHARGVTDSSDELIVPSGEEYILYGEHAYNKQIIINGTLYMKPFDSGGTAKSGTLSLKAPVISIDGMIDASGRGYGGGGGGGGAQYPSWGTAGYGGKGGKNGNGGDGGNGANGYGGGGGGGSQSGAAGNGGSGAQVGSSKGGGAGGSGTSGEANNGGNGGNGFGAGGGGGGGGGHVSYYWYYDGGGGGGGGGSGGSDGSTGTYNCGGNGGDGSGSYSGKGGMGLSYYYGGEGGKGGYGAQESNGDSSSDFSAMMGSGGGGGGGSMGGSSGTGGGGGGAGGGAILLEASGNMLINGAVISRGSPGGYGAYSSVSSQYRAGSGGPGSGGGIALQAINFTFSGKLDVTSPNNGVGGTIKVISHKTILQGQYQILNTNGRYYSQTTNNVPQGIISVDSDRANIDAPVTFFSSNSYDKDGDVLQSKYSFGDGYSSEWSWNPVQHAFKKSGDYFATVMVRDNYGGENQSTPIKIHVNYPPLAAISAEEAVAKIGQVVHFTAGGSTDVDGTVAQYFFDFGDGDVSGWLTTPDVNHMYRQIGIYYPSVLVKDNNGEESDKTAFTEVDVTVEGLPTDNIPPVASLAVASASVLTDVPVRFDCSGSYDDDGSVVSYLLDFGDGHLADWSTSPVGIHTFQYPGTYNVTLRVKDNAGDTSLELSSIRITVSQNQPPTPVTLQYPAYSNSSTSLTWTLSNEPDFLRYEVHVSPFKEFQPSQGTLARIVNEIAATTVALPGITELSGLYFKVRVVDFAGYVADSNVVPEHRAQINGTSTGSGNVIQNANETGIMFSNSVKYKGGYYLSELSTITVLPPANANNPVSFYGIDASPTIQYGVPFSLPLLMEGDHSLNFYSMYGNISETTRTVVFKYDLRPPTISFINPSSKALMAKSFVDAQWSGTDDASGIDHYQVKLDASDWMDTGGSSTQTFSDLPEGGHKIIVKAFDRVGHPAESSITFTVDTAPPELAILSPAQGLQTSAGKITIVWTATDKSSEIATVMIKTDSGSYHQIQNASSYELKDLKNGIHVVVLKLTDGAGNSVERGVSFTKLSSTAGAEGNVVTDNAMISIMGLILVVVLVVMAGMGWMFVRAIRSRQQPQDNAPAPDYRYPQPPAAPQQSPPPIPPPQTTKEGSVKRMTIEDLEDDK